MSAYGGNSYGRRRQREGRRRKLVALSYVGLVMLAVVTASVVVLALQK